MKRHSEQHIGSRRLLLLVFALFAVSLATGAGCLSIKLVADYDATLDQSITEFQKAMERHLTTLDRQIGTPASDYNNHVSFYDDARVTLSSTRVRACAQSQNEITVQQIDLLIENIAALETMHKQGLNRNDIPPLRNAFNQGCTAILKFELEKKRGRDI